MCLLFHLKSLYNSKKIWNADLWWMTMFSRKSLCPFKSLLTVSGQKHLGTPLQLHVVNWFDTSCTHHVAKNKFLLLSLPQINHHEILLSQLS